MAGWVQIENGDYIAADVIRWREVIFKPRRSRKAKAIRLGEIQIVAEVLEKQNSQGYIFLLIRKCDLISEFTARKLSPLTPGTQIKRSDKKIARGNPERLLWSDESARDIVKMSNYPYFE